MYESFSEDIETLVSIFGSFMVIVIILCLCGVVTWIDLFIERKKKQKELK